MRKEQIVDGSLIKHKYVLMSLIVRDDKKGPAYTDNEFEDNEIALSYAISEFEAGNITEIIPPKKEPEQYIPDCPISIGEEFMKWSEKFYYIKDLYSIRNDPNNSENMAYSTARQAFVFKINSIVEDRLIGKK